VLRFAISKDTEKVGIVQKLQKEKEPWRVQVNLGGGLVAV